MQFRTVSLCLDAHGALMVLFRADPTPFPGRLVLEGCFIIEGEYAVRYLQGFEKLVAEGEPLGIEQEPSADCFQRWATSSSR